MGFGQSVINQIGRDTGKVISNQIFKGAHSTPVRMIGKTETPVPVKRVVKTEFEKSINFQMGFKPNTLVNKISGAQIVMRNEMKKFLVDGYLSTDESDDLFKMIGEFNSKVSDVYDVLKIDTEKNKAEIALIDKIMYQTLETFCDILDTSIKGCDSKSKEYTQKAKNVVKKSFWIYVLLHSTICLGKYASTSDKKDKKIVATILVNLFIVVPFLFVYPVPFLNILMIIIGTFKYPSEIKKYKELVANYNLMSELESKRIDIYSSIKESNLKTLEEIK